MTSEQGQDHLASLEHWMLVPAPQVCDLSGFSGQPGGSQAGYYYLHDCHHHLHFIDDQ